MTTMRRKQKRSQGIAAQSFVESVSMIVTKIRPGMTLSYGEVARRAGYPGAARAVGTVVKHNRNREVPCHRVIRSDGSIGQYAFGGTRRKIERLRQEGVKIRDGKKVFPQ